MTKMKFAMAVLAVGGGAAAQAQAATTTNYFYDDAGSNYDISLAGATSPQYSYNNTGSCSQTFAANGSNEIGTSLLSAYTLPPAGQSYSSTQTYTEDFFPETMYIPLKFTAEGTTYIGTAYIDSDAELESVTYQAVPEPDVWALLIAGAGLTGAALRRSRRQVEAIG